MIDQMHGKPNEMSTYALYVFLCIPTVWFVIWIESLKNDSFSLVPLLMLILLASFARIQQGSWLAPGAFFALMWSVFIFSSFFGAIDYELHPTPLWWILWCSIVIYIGSLLGSGVGMNRFVPNRSLRQLSHCAGGNGTDALLTGLVGMVLVCSIIGFIAVAILIRSIGMGISSLFSFDMIVQMGMAFKGVNVDSQYQQPMIYSILFSGMLAGVLFGGVLFAISPSWKYRLVAFFPFLVAMANTIVKTNRGTIVFALVLWISSYFASMVFLNRGAVRIFGLKLAALTAGLFLSLGALFVLLQASREGLFGSAFLGLVLLNLKSAAFGSVHAFSYWFENAWSATDPTWGAHTFNRIYFYLFSTPETTPDAVWLGLTVRESTNIFTVFQAVLQDFRLAGSLVFFFIIGVVSGRSFRGLVKGYIIHIPVLALFYSFTIIGYLASIFAWNNVLLGFFIFAFYFAIKGFNAGPWAELTF